MKLNLFLTVCALSSLGQAASFAFVNERTIQTVRKPSSVSLRMSEDANADDAKVCLVTGSSRGIGRCIALELVKTGNVKIVINDIEPMREEAEIVCQEIRDAGGEAIVVTADCKYSRLILKRRDLLKHMHLYCWSSRPQYRIFFNC